MPRKSIRDIQKMKNADEPIVMLTAYDAMSARLAEKAGVPMLLVGDTLGMVVQGHDSTIPVTLEHMIYHCEIVSRVTESPVIVGDMPFMTAGISIEKTLESAARLMQEGGATCIKLEGGAFMARTVERIVQAGIPVMGHIGLTPQSVQRFGGFRVQGRSFEQALQLIHDAEALEAAGAFAVVLELVPSELAQLITERLHIPTIGIGAGTGCDGQVQVFHDILGLFDDFIPRHTKRYSEVGETIRAAISQYAAEVQEEQFPAAENSFTMKAEILEKVRERLAQEEGRHAGGG